MKGAMFVLCLLMFELSAQEKKEATQKDVDVKEEAKPQKTDAPLPKIDLPEFVITGNEKIDLNISSKAVDDEDRLFVPDKPTPGFRSLEIDGAVAQKQVKRFTQTPTALNGKIFASLGFYLTPQFDAWFGEYDEKNSIMVNGYYSSSEGHANDAGWWRGGGGAKGRYVMPDSSSFLPYMQLSGDIRYGRESYRAYGSAAPGRTRDLSGYDFSLGAGSRYALPYKTLSGFDYTGRFGWSHFAANDSGSSSETDFFLNGVATTRFIDIAFRGQIEYRTTGYTFNLPGVQSGQWFVVQGEAQTLLVPSLLSTLTLQQLFYRGNVGATSGRFYPQIELKYFMTESASMYAGYAPTVERNTLATLIKQNRYMEFDARLLPSDVQLDLHAGMEFSPSDEITANARYTYRRIDNYPTFLETGGAKVWEVTYLSGVRSNKLDVSVLYKFNDKQNMTAYVSTQDLKQNDSSGVVPHVPAFSVGSVYHYFFDFGLHVEALAEYVSSRYTNFVNTHSNAGYIFTAVKGDIELMERFRGYAEIQNALNRHYFIWNGYRERTIYLSFGISYHW